MHECQAASQSAVASSLERALYADPCGLLKPCLVLEGYSERRRIRTFDGTDTVVHRSDLKPFELCPGALAVALDGERGAYIPSLIHEVRTGGIAAENAKREVVWYAHNEVYLDTVVPGSRMGRHVGDNWESYGTIARISSRSMWLNNGQGLCHPWRDDEVGNRIGIHPKDIAPDAPRRATATFGAVQAKAAGKMIGLFAAAYLVVLVLGVRWYLSMALAVGAGVGLHYLGKKLALTVRFERRSDFLLTVVIISLLLLIPMAILARDGFSVLTGILLLSVMTFCVMGSVMPEEPKKFVAEDRESSSSFAEACARWMGTRRTYEQGELCQFRLPNAKQMCIGRVVRHQGNTVTIKHRGDVHEIPHQHVQPFLLAAGQRLSIDVKGQIRHAVVQGFRDQGCVVRFDLEKSPSFDVRDFSTVGLESLRLPFNMRFFDKTEAELEEIVHLTDEAMDRANAACGEGRIGEAHDALNWALQRCPYMPTLHLGKAMAYQMEGDHKKVLAHASEVLQTYGGMWDQASIYVIVTNSLWAIGRDLDALHAALAALNIEPLEKGHWVNAVTAFAKLGKHDEGRAFAAVNELI